MVTTAPSALTIERRCQTAFVSRASEAIGAAGTVDGPVVAPLQAGRERAAMSAVMRHTKRDVIDDS